MAASAAASGLRGRIEPICAAAGDARTTRLELLAEVRRAVPFDAYAWPLTDPETEVGSAPLADVPCLPELPQLIRLRYLTPLNRWTALIRRPVALLSAATGGDLAQSALWRDLLCRYDVSDVASIVFRDRWGCWAFLELWRMGGARFSAAEAAVLGEVVRPVTAALRASQARAFDGSASHPRPEPLVLLLSPDLAVQKSTPATQAALRLLVPRDDDLPPVPAGAYNVAAQLLAVEAGVDAHPPRARVHLTGGTWLTLRAARLDDGGAPAARDIAVTIEESSPVERLGLFAGASALTGRERELVEHLVAGRDTREVAGRMFLAEHTVQDHLKSVFAKTGTRSRRALLARLLGAAGDQPP
jgi:DNA-binding CsgD family transcriptional regulator